MLHFVNTVAEVTLDSNGHAEISLDLDQPRFLYYEWGHVMGPVYLTPGKTLRLTLNNFKLEFSEDGGAINSLLKESITLQNSMMEKEGTPIFLLSPSDFLERFDSLQDILQKFQSESGLAKGLSRKERHLLTQRREVLLASLIQTYAHVNMGIKLPEEIEKMAETIPLHSELLKAGYLEYNMLLDRVLDREYYFPIWEGEAEVDYYSTQHPVKVHQKIKSQGYSKEFEELLAAKNIHFWLLSGGITPAVDSAITLFSKDFGGSEYQPLLEEKYRQWKRISPGEIAPDFTGELPGGEQLSMKDLRGKVVYIDFWATWCKPCIESFGYYPALYEKFADRDDLVFLFVSIDKNMDAWKNFLEKKGQELPGIHINHDGTVLEEYLNWGVPRYVLVSAEGKIINAYAPKPSSPRIFDALQSAVELK
jgi:thiol-disulfide isomerase/thioredoxin